LIQLSQRVRRDLRRDVAEEVPDEPRDDADESVRSVVRDLVNSMDERDAALAQAMEAALERIDRGGYGICVVCQRPIELERLELLPWAIRCADDQEAFERQMQLRPPKL
jgi:RNA polymerase-binding transcription factor DksA